MAEIVPRWEWRTFGEDFGAAEEAFAALSEQRVEESDELYLLARASDASVKVRDALMDVKRLQRIDDGLEQWVPVMKATFPLTAENVGAVFDVLRVAAPVLDRAAYSLHDLVEDVVQSNDALRAVEVHKRRSRYTLEGCMAELSDVRTETGATRTIAVEAEDPARVQAAVSSLGLTSRANVCMARGLKTLVGFGTTRFAAIDVGTNSVKLHVGDRHADGTWSSVADRAVVTRLGEGLHAGGNLEQEPMRRTIEAIAEMTDESRRAGAVAIAAVGTAGLRAAANSAAFVDAAEARAGVRIEIIPGEEEGRLAYLAATSGLRLARGSLVVFDTGGGSSQFTFGRGNKVDEQFSVPVGAARLTERFGLAGIVSDEALGAALEGIAAELDCLDDRSSPDQLVGMGGAVTNLAAVEHALAAYDPAIVQGARLDRAEVDRQIELYRTRTTDERRAVVGLQPNRAEVILAGACVVRTVLTKLGCESLVVSDRGLRHGLIADRFALGPPVG
jgi:exopolyphosphatase/guanosine-5'-triphosphate,3'-diphosphate pyrophosphatase